MASNGIGNEGLPTQGALHMLWQRPALVPIKAPEPLWHLRVNVLKDEEGHHDCPSRTFVGVPFVLPVSPSTATQTPIHVFSRSALTLLQTFKSLHHLTHATNQLDAAFWTSLKMNKCGVEFPDAMGGRVNDGRSENVTIEFDSEKAEQTWAVFVELLTAIEDNWDREAQIALEGPSVV